AVVDDLHPAGWYADVGLDLPAAVVGIGYQARRTSHRPATDAPHQTALLKAVVDLRQIRCVEAADHENRRPPHEPRESHRPKRVPGSEPAEHEVAPADGRRDRGQFHRRARRGTVIDL